MTLLNAVLKAASDWGAAPFSPANLSDERALQSWAKGDGGTYRVMMFTASGGRVPKVLPFVAGTEWKLYDFPFQQFGATVGQDVQAILFSGGLKPGPLLFQNRPSKADLTLEEGPRMTAFQSSQSVFVIGSKQVERI